MDEIGLSEIMQPTANYGKISEKPVKVDTMNHKVCCCNIQVKLFRQLNEKYLMNGVGSTKTNLLFIQAVIDVNTQGVEAAAATSVSIVPKFGSFKVSHHFNKGYKLLF